MQCVEVLCAVCGGTVCSVWRYCVQCVEALCAVCEGTVCSAWRYCVVCEGIV